MTLEEATRLECILQADVSWSDPEGDGTGGGGGDGGGGGGGDEGKYPYTNGFNTSGGGRWTPDPFDNCPAFDLCALSQYRGKHGQLCDERRAREGGAGR